MQLTGQRSSYEPTQICLRTNPSSGGSCLHNVNIRHGHSSSRFNTNVFIGDIPEELFQTKKSSSEYQDHDVSPQSAKWPPVMVSPRETSQPVMEAPAAINKAGPGVWNNLTQECILVVHQITSEGARSTRHKMAL